MDIKCFWINNNSKQWRRPGFQSITLCPKSRAPDTNNSPSFATLAATITRKNFPFQFLFINISRLRIDVLVFLMNTTGAASCTWIDSHILTWTGYNPWLVHWFSQSRPRDCLKPMNRLQLYPSSFKKNRFVQFYQCTIDNSLCSFRQFEGKPSCEASYCKILVINNPIKHNRGVPSSEAARPRPGQPPPPRPAPVEATQSSLSFVVPVSCSAI